MRQFLKYFIVTLLVTFTLLATLYRPAHSVGVEIPTVAFCGPDMGDRSIAAKALESMSNMGVDVVAGRCKVPRPGYTPATPQDRYATPGEYRQLVGLAAHYGLKVLVFDPALSAPDRLTRAIATADWLPYRENIWAVDLGDEFDPRVPEQWNDLVERWHRVSDAFTPYTNHLPWADARDRAVTDLGAATFDSFYSFDEYDVDRAVWLAKEYSAQTATLMCYVNAMTTVGKTATLGSIVSDSAQLVDAGCDIIGLFGGFPVYGTDEFGTTSLVDRFGNSTMEVQL